jgi:hypothetical protein
MSGSKSLNNLWPTLIQHPRSFLFAHVLSSKAETSLAINPLNIKRFLDYPWNDKARHAGAKCEELPRLSRQR